MEPRPWGGGLSRSMHEDDPLDDFARREITLDGVAKRVHVAGTGPAVIVMTEMPGISPHVARFARWVRDAGFTVYMPSLFGRDGAVPTRRGGRRRLPAGLRQRRVPRVRRQRVEPGDAVAARARAARARGMRRARRRRHRHVLHRQLRAHDDARALDARAGAVASRRCRWTTPPALEIAPDELAAVRERLEREDLTVLAYRFEGDQFCRARALRRLRGGARRPLRRARAARQRGQHRVAPFFEQRRREPAQRRHRPPDRRGRPADDRRARRDPGVLRRPARAGWMTVARS